MNVVFDTNVLVSALHSNRGASFRLIQLVENGDFTPVVSSPLCLEYEDVLHRTGLLPDLSAQDIDNFIDYFLSFCVECSVYFLWRPYLPDSKDDLVLEIALAGQASLIITHNLRHFGVAASLGIQAVTPRQFVAMLPSL